MNPAAFYGRVSTDQQDGSLETQLAKARAYAHVKNLEILDALQISDSDTSGGLPLRERDGGQLLLNSLKLYPQVKHLIVTKLDRLGRSVIDLELTFQDFKARGIIVHIVDFGGDSFTTAGFLGDLVIRILSAVAEFERMMIRSRIQDRLDHKRAKGELTGTVPYGMDKVSTGRTNAKGKEIFTLVENPEEQHWLRQMAEWRSMGWSYKQIADELNRQGVPTKIQKGTLICVGKNQITGEKLYQPHTGRWQCGNVAGVLASKYTQQILIQPASAA